MKKICVTGANGFIGKSICRSLIKWGIFVRGTVRSQNLTSKTSNYECVSVGDISNNTNWSEAIFGCECIIHSAGIAHKINELDGENSQIYQKVNVDATKKLANQAVDAGVKRLIFLSSIKVNGESTEKFFQTQVLKNEYKKVFSHDDILAPEDNYAASKLEAEKVLWDISAKAGLEIVILRLPLVYGPGVKGNLAKLLNIIRLGIPLPLGGIKNKRSMIGIDNLVDLLIRCIDHPEASGKTFLASDGEDLSTPELIKFIASSMERKASLFPLPIFMLKFLGSVFGRREEINRLVGSLRIDNSYTKETLNWTPPLSVEEGIRKMVQGK
jgi:nucleoside-diphosphate-sugar epimerase